MNDKKDSNTNDLQPWRKSFRKRAEVALVTAAGSALLHVIAATMRVRGHRHDVSEALRKQHGRYIHAMFHGSHVPLLCAMRHHDVHVITSYSADGEILTRILKHFGYKAVRGSSTRGGMRAMIDLAKQIKAGHDVAIAVDGPRGPRQQVKGGIMLLGKLSGVPIIPVAVAMNWYKRFNSWDQFQLTLPFSRVLLVGGEPMLIPRNADDQQIEQLRKQFEEHLVALQHEADEAVKTEATAQAMLKKYEKKE
jgi:lysophospholipid acyltransferase (LPLAT)-like uncharacterized protein